ncbi:MAG: TrbC/VirB2 family protein [Paracoccaceae bacterium]|nr:TrbC/VirB2 family protein [Paracoccaceae bacterium]
MKALYSSRSGGFDAGTDARVATRLLRAARQPLSLALAVGLICLLVPHGAHAADTTGGGGAGLPWETPLNQLKASMTGPVAFVISIVGVIAAGATLIWGGEVSEFARRIIYLIMVICVIIFANTLLTGALFSGAIVPPHGLAG